MKIFYDFLKDSAFSYVSAVKTHYDEKLIFEQPGTTFATFAPVLLDSLHDFEQTSHLWWDKGKIRWKT
jgi:hypothetical protein